MGLLQVALIIATFLCSIVAGFLFAFSIVVMAGIGNLGNREFIRTFQAIDGIIQNKQPIFMLVWPGSIIALIVTTVFGFRAHGWHGALAPCHLYCCLSVRRPFADIYHQRSHEQQTPVSECRCHG